MYVYIAHHGLRKGSNVYIKYTYIHYTSATILHIYSTYIHIYYMYTTYILQIILHK